MKTFFLGLAVLSGVLTLKFCQKSAQSTSDLPVPESVYDIEIKDIKGEKLDLKQFKGKKILFVNVASKCGFTKQYADLQKLYATYKDKLVVIGLPCNQFAKQEPGTPAEIASFCRLNYGVEFPITEKIAVKGKNRHPLYAWLTQIEQNGVESSSVRWNFHKYMVNEEGKYLKFWRSKTKPMDEEIIAYLK